MSDAKKERRINIEDLPAPEKELTAEEAKQVQGGIANIADQTVKTGDGSVSSARTGGVRVAVGDVTG